jgi:hypothetical protein
MHPPAPILSTRRHALRFALVGALPVLASCSPPAPPPASGRLQRLEFQDEYPGGLPRAKWAQSLGVELLDFAFGEIPLVIVHSASPTSYGNSYDVFVYYRMNIDEPESESWGQCLRFSARSYLKLRFDLNVEHDHFRIYGIVPKDNQEELLLERRRFHDSFTQYTPKHT